MIVEESINVVFDESNHMFEKKDTYEVDFEQIFSKEKTIEKVMDEKNVETQWSNII